MVLRCNNWCQLREMHLFFGHHEKTGAVGVGQEEREEENKGLNIFRDPTKSTNERAHIADDN